MTETSGSEIGQVFVRISAVGDAMKVLRELQTEFRRTLALTNQFDNIEGMEDTVTPMINRMAALETQLERVIGGQLQLRGAISNVTEEFSRQAAAVVKGAKEQQSANREAVSSSVKIAIVASQSAIATGDYANAAKLANQAIQEAGTSQLALQTALLNYVKIINQVSTGSSALGRAITSNADAQMRFSAQTTKTADQLVADFQDMQSQITKVQAHIQGLGGEFSALSKTALNRLQRDLGNTLQKNVVHMLSLTEKTQGLRVASREAAGVLKTVSAELEKYGQTAALVEAKVSQLQAAEKRRAERSGAQMERARITTARESLESIQYQLNQAEHEAEKALSEFRAETQRLASAMDSPAREQFIRDRGGQEALRRETVLIREQRAALIQLANAHERATSYGQARVKITRTATSIGERMADTISKETINMAKAAIAAKDYARAVQIVNQRLGQMNTTLDATNVANRQFLSSLDPRELRGSIAVQRQLEGLRGQAQGMAASPRGRWWDSAVGQLRNLSGTVLALTGAFYTLQGAAMSALQAMQAGAQYSVIQAQLKLLAESTEEYNQALEISRKNIALFGGSIVDNLQNMNRLILLSNQSGASIEDLNDMLLLLSTKDPVQGIEGASIALNEALSEGTTRSLRQRFELGGEQLKMFTDQTLTANEQLALFEKELQKIGLSMELLEGSVSIGARSVNEFSAAWEEAMLVSGQALNNSLVVPMGAMTVVLQNAISLLKTYNELVESGAKAREGQSSLLSLGSSLAFMMLPGSTLIDTLFRFAGAEVFQNIIASFTQMSPAAKDAAGGIKDLNDEMAAGEAQAKRQADAINEYIEKLILQTITEENNAEAKARLLDIAYQYGEGIIDMAAAQKLLSDEFSFTTNNTEQLAVALNAFHQEALKARQELLSAAEASKAAANAMLEYIQQVVSSANEEAARAKALEELNRIALDLHNGTITLAEAGTQLQSSFGMTADMATVLAGQLRVLGSQAAITQQELVNAAAAAEAAFRQSMSAILQTRALIGKTGVEAAKIRVDQARDVLRQFQGRPTESMTQEEQLARAEAMNRLMEAQNELAREQVSLASDWAIETQRVQQRIDQLLPEYEQLVKYGDLATDSQKQRRLELAREIEMLRNKLPKAEKGGGAGGGSAARDDQSKLNDQLAMDQLKADQAAEDALIAHEERMLEIRKDYAERTLRAIEGYQEDQKSGRASFYESLTGIEDHGLQKAMSAQFEAAAMEAGKIAQTLGPDVAAQFLQQMQTNILNQAKRQQEIAKALDKNGEDFNPALAEYLQGVDQLFRVSEQGAINKILRARDSLASQEVGAVEEAQQKYIDALLKISDNAAESAERRIEAVRLAGKEIDLEIAKVEELGIMYEKIGFVPGSQRTVELQAFPGVQLDGNPENLTGIAAEIAAALQAIRNNTGDTVGAIRRLAPSVTQ